MFSPARQRSLLAEDGRTHLSQAQEYLEEVLGEKLPVCKEQRDKTLLPLDNYVETRRERVTLMVVCNEKCHKYREKLEDLELVHHPGCHVIIDNRPGVAQLAIERSDSFETIPPVCEPSFRKPSARLSPGSKSPWSYAPRCVNVPSGKWWTTSASSSRTLSRR